MRSRYGRRAFRAYPIRCVGERIKVTGVPEFREVAWRAWVILMAINSVFGVLLHIYFFDGINAQVQAYWLASVPVVVVGAPLGAYFCSRMQYLHIRYLLIALISIELVTSLWLLDFDRTLIIFSISTLALFLAVMISMSRAQCYARSSEQECV